MFGSFPKMATTEQLLSMMNLVTFYLNMKWCHQYRQKREWTVTGMPMKNPAPIQGCPAHTVTNPITVPRAKEPAIET